jgi:lipid II:glycine glycyltransferase (peptidoglycan interpeptide bridge formation enzyme)
MQLRQLAESEALPTGADFLQSDFWADVKTGTEWKAHRFALHSASGEPGGSEVPLLVLERRLPLGFTCLYVPHGPYCDGRTRVASEKSLFLGQAEIDIEGLWNANPAQNLSDSITEIAKALKPFTRASTLFVRFDLPQYLKDTDPFMLAKNLKPTLAVQPPDTVILDLQKGEEELQQAMKPKWRYNIRLAEKKGVVVERHRARDCDEESAKQRVAEFYELYKETAERDKIALHGARYYEKLFLTARKHAESVDVSLFNAVHEGKLLASIITVFYGDKAVYLYGASSNEGRNLMPAYALQWAAIQAAKAEGCISYDFFGIPPDDDPNHPMHGLYRFKTGFGGEVIHRLGCYDLPRLRLPYLLFVGANTARVFWFKKVKKLLKRRGPKAEATGSAEASGSAKTEE